MDKDIPDGCPSCGALPCDWTQRPDKRGNPPFEPSNYAAGLERRVKRHSAWREAALAHAADMMSDHPLVRAAAEGWWRQQLNPVKVELS